MVVIAWTRTLFGVAGTTVSSVFPDTFVGNLQIKGPRPWIDVRAYEAVGNDVADDTTAINNAIAAIPSTGGTLFFPAGTYRVTAALTAISTNNTSIIGTGMHSIIKQVTASADLFTISHATSVRRLQFHGLFLEGTDTAARALVLSNAGDLSIRDVQIDNFLSHGIDITGGIHIGIYDTRIDAGASPPAAARAIRTSNTPFAGTTIVIQGVYMTGYNTLLDVNHTAVRSIGNIYETATTAITVSGTANGFLSLGDYFEAITGKKYNLNDGNSAAIIFPHGVTDITSVTEVAFTGYAGQEHRVSIFAPLAGTAAQTAVRIGTDGVIMRRLAAGELSFSGPVASDSSSGAATTRFRHRQSMARVRNSADQSIADATLIALTWDTEDFDADGLHSTVSNTNRLTAAIAGKYLIIGNVTWASNATGRREVFIRDKDTTIQAVSEVAAVSGSSTRQNVGTLLSLAATDWVEVAVRQNSTAALNVTSAGTNFQMVYIGE